jgi:hypothetical protein
MKKRMTLDAMSVTTLIAAVVLLPFLLFTTCQAMNVEPLTPPANSPATGGR